MLRSLLIATCAVLCACQGHDEPQVISNGQPVPGSVPVNIQVGPTRDPSLPDASAVAAQMAADKAREDALAQQQPVTPPSAEEPVTPPGATPVARGSNTSLTPAPEGTKLN